jgi:putative N6-adenine-specific DNA methylase
MKNRPFVYEKHRRFFAQVPDGVEDLAIREIEKLGGREIEPDFRGVRFSATPSAMYRINYCARLLTRVLAPLASFRCNDRDDLYNEGKRIDWQRLFSVRDTFGIFSTGANNPNLRNSKFAALCLKDAVADYFRSKGGRRPNVHKTEPDVWLNLHIEGQRATVNLDISGGSLHRRGYRQRTVQAPLQETLAAAMVAFSDWRGDRPLYDPMCGSATLLCEALMHAAHIPAGYLKPKFGFRFLPDHDEDLWLHVKKSADDAITPLARGLVSGSDLDPLAVMASNVNRRVLPGGDSVQIFRKDFQELGGLENSVILCNPPYGIRMRGGEDLSAFYRSFGDFLKRRCTGSEAYVFFGNREMIKHIGLRPDWKKPIRNAGLDARIAKYVLY